MTYGKMDPRALSRDLSFIDTVSFFFKIIFSIMRAISNGKFVRLTILAKILRGRFR